MHVRRLVAVLLLLALALLVALAVLEHALLLLLLVVLLLAFQDVKDVLLQGGPLQVVAVRIWLQLLQELALALVLLLLRVLHGLLFLFFQLWVGVLPLV